MQRSRVLIVDGHVSLIGPRGDVMTYEAAQACTLDEIAAELHITANRAADMLEDADAYSNGEDGD